MRTSARFVLTLSALALFGAATTAIGAPRDADVATKVVRFKDLDLATAAGAQMLYERIAGAARTVCRGAAPYAAVRACRTRAIEDAVRIVGSPLLSSVHRSTTERVEEVVLR